MLGATLPIPRPPGLGQPRKPPHRRRTVRHRRRLVPRPPPSEILGIARRAADLSPGSPRILDTLAAAQANAGDFPAAMATASRALALVPPGCPLIPLLSSHLDLYRSAHSLRQ